MSNKIKNFYDEPNKEGTEGETKPDDSPNGSISAIHMSALAMNGIENEVKVIDETIVRRLSVDNTNVVNNNKV